jgi:hypothetical protein
MLVDAFLSVREDALAIQEELRDVFPAAPNDATPP